MIGSLLSKATNVVDELGNKTGEIMQGMRGVLSPRLIEALKRGELKIPGGILEHYMYKNLEDLEEADLERVDFLTVA